MTAIPTNERLPVGQLWWLQPAWLFAAVVGGTMALAALQSENAYRLYGTPKYIDATHVLMALGAIAAFAFGRQFAAATGEVPEPFPDSREPALRAWFYLATALTLLGYGVWLASAMRNGLSMDAIRQFMAGDRDYFREDVLKTIPGVTTCTQFGIAAAILGTWLALRGVKGVLLPLTIIVGLSAFRAVLNSERLAMFEVIIPAGVVVVRLVILGRPLPALQRGALQLLPIFGVVALLVLFGAFEYVRSWRSYEKDFDSLAEFTLWRVGGYYTTAHNNGALAWELRGQWPLPYATLNQFWQFPLVEHSPFSYQAITGIDPEEIKLLTLDRYGTPEFNSDGGLFLPALDFGLVGFAVCWLVIGFVAGRLYREFLAGSFVGMAFYPLVFVSLLEVPRILYLTHARSLAPLAFMLLLSLSLRGRVVFSNEPSPTRAATTA